MSGSEASLFRPGDNAPPFAEPWQAQVFALTLALHQQGLFTWTHWAETLGAEIAAAGRDDDGSGYYHSWLAATERLVAEKRLADAEGLADRKAAWERAALATPHGSEIRLENDPLFGG